MFTRIDLDENNTKRSELSTAACLVTGFVIFTFCSYLIYALIHASKMPPAVVNTIFEKLRISGVENPVTAVLLNFRSFDTLLEIAVLLLVASAMLPANSNATQFLKIRHHVHDDPALPRLIHWLVPLSIISGGYLLWTGAYTPGGAFQAGALIAGAGITMSVAGPFFFSWNSTLIRLALGFGLLLFIFIGGLNFYLTGTILQYPESYASIFILLIEIAATISIALILLTLFTHLKVLQEKT